MRGPVRYLTVIVIALAVPAFLGAAAWGGEPRSKKEFLKQGNAICAEGDDQIGELFEQTFGPSENAGEDPPPEAIEAFTAGLIPIIRQVIADIDALESPTKDAKKVQKIIDAYTDAVEAVEEDPTMLAEEGSGNVFARGN